MLIKVPFNPRARWDLLGKAICDDRSLKTFREMTSQNVLKHKKKPGLALTTTQKVAQLSAYQTQQPAQLSAP